MDVSWQVKLDEQVMLSVCVSAVRFMVSVCKSALSFRQASFCPSDDVIGIHGTEELHGSSSTLQTVLPEI